MTTVPRPEGESQMAAVVLAITAGSQAMPEPSGFSQAWRRSKKRDGSLLLGDAVPLSETDTVHAPSSFANP